MKSIKNWLRFMGAMLCLEACLCGPVYVGTNGILINLGAGDGQSTNFFNVNQSYLAPALSGVSLPDLSYTTRSFTAIGNCAWPSGSQYTAYTTATSQRYYTNKTDVDGVVLTYSMLYGSDTNYMGTNSIDIAASVVYNGFINPVFFNNGHRLYLLGPNSTIDSDDVKIQMPSGSVFTVRSFATRIADNSYSYNGEYGNLATDGASMPKIIQFAGASGTWNTGDGVTYSTTNAVNPFLTTNGNAVDSAVAIGGNGNVGIIPVHVTGYVKNSNKQGIFVACDSLGAGAGSVLQSTPDGIGSFVYIALYDIFPLGREAEGGDRLANWCNDTTANQNTHVRARWVKYAKNAIVGLGVNDVNTAGGNQSLSGVQSLAVKVWTRFANEGCRVYACTLAPRTTSTDLWQTTTNQTLNNTNGNAFNAWLRAGAPGTNSFTYSTNSFTGTVSIVTNFIPVVSGTSGAITNSQVGHPLFWWFDTASAVESSVGSGLWAPPTVYQGTSTATGGSSGTPSTLIDSGQAWPTTGNGGLGGLVGLTVYDVTAGVMREITANTATQITVANGGFAVSPSGHTYQILNSYVYEDDGLGVHPALYGHKLMAPLIVTNAFN